MRTNFVVNTEKVAHKTEAILNVLQREVFKHLINENLQMLLAGYKFYLLIIAVFYQIGNNLKKILSKCVSFIMISSGILVVNF